jgi:hypothetical protein
MPTGQRSSKAKRRTGAHVCVHDARLGRRFSGMRSCLATGSSSARKRGACPTRAQQFTNEQRVRLPMRPGNRSLNLSNTVAVVTFEAWRQAGFEGGA